MRGTDKYVAKSVVEVFDLLIPILYDYLHATATLKTRRGSISCFMRLRVYKSLKHDKEYKIFQDIIILQFIYN